MRFFYLIAITLLLASCGFNTGPSEEERQLQRDVGLYKAYMQRTEHFINQVTTSPEKYPWATLQSKENRPLVDTEQLKRLVEMNVSVTDINDGITELAFHSINGKAVFVSTDSPVLFVDKQFKIQEPATLMRMGILKELNGKIYLDRPSIRVQHEYLKELSDQERGTTQALFENAEELDPFATPTP